MYLYVEIINTKNAYEDLMLFDTKTVSNRHKRVKRIKLTDEQIKELQTSINEDLYLLSIQDD